jgi:hypothetical protein
VGRSRRATRFVDCPELAAGTPQERVPDVAGPETHDFVDMARRTLAVRRWYDPLVQRLNAEGHPAHAITSGRPWWGHSYGSSVITAVADGMPGRVGALVYL